MRTASFACLLLTCHALATSPASAQLLLNPVQDYINRTTLLNNIMSNARANDMIARSQNAGQPPANAPETEVLPPTMFKAAEASILPKRLAGGVGPSAARQQAAEKNYESLIDQYQQTASHDGFPANDVAYAMEYLVVNGYMIYHDLHEVPYENDPYVKGATDPLERLQLMAQKRARKPTLGEERAVYRQLQALLGARPEIQQMADAQKQELAELLAITLGQDLTAYLAAVNAADDAALRRAKESTRAHLEKFLALPMDRLRIGPEGMAL